MTGTNEIPASLLDYMKFYLLNYFKPGLYRQTREHYSTTETIRSSTTINHYVIARAQR